jgi:hypothetical protein
MTVHREKYSMSHILSNSLAEGTAQSRFRYASTEYSVCAQSVVHFRVRYRFLQTELKGPSYSNKTITHL